MRYFKTFTLLALVSIVVLDAQNVRAQEVPDPFEAYEGDQRSQPAENSSGDPVANSNSESANRNRADDWPNLELAVQEGQWQISTGMSFSFDRSTNELLSGNDITNSTYLFRLGFGFGHYLWDRILIEGVAQIMMRRLARDNNASSTEQDWLFQARAWYILPLSDRLGFLSGIALGGYVGSSSRQFSLDESNFNEETTTVGFASDLMAGAKYMVSDSTSLLMLLDFTWLLGSENVPSLDENLSLSSTHFGLSLGFTYTF